MRYSSYPTPYDSDVQTVLGEERMAISKRSASANGRTTVRIPEELHHRAKMAATWSGIKLQEFIAEAIERYLVAAESAMDNARSQTSPTNIRKH